MEGKRTQEDPTVSQTTEMLPPGVEFRGGLYSEAHNLYSSLTTALETVEKNQPRYLGEQGFLTVLAEPLREYHEFLEDEAKKNHWADGVVALIEARSDKGKTDSFNMWIRTATTFKESLARRIDRLMKSRAAQALPNHIKKNERAVAEAMKGLRIALDRLNELAFGLPIGSSGGL